MRKESYSAIELVCMEAERMQEHAINIAGYSATSKVARILAIEKEKQKAIKIHERAWKQLMHIHTKIQDI